MSYCDNAAVVVIVNKGDCREAEAMHLLRCLAFLKAKFEFSLYCTHIQGTSNELADTPSRDKAQVLPTGKPHPNPDTDGAARPHNGDKAKLYIQ